MKWFLFYIACGFTLATAAESPKIHQPVDQTDVFAIPLDEDDDEQEEELKSLEHPKK